MGKSRLQLTIRLFLIASVVLMSCFLGCVSEPGPNDGTDPGVGSCALTLEGFASLNADGQNGIYG